MLQEHKNVLDFMRKAIDDGDFIITEDNRMNFKMVVAKYVIVTRTPHIVSSYSVSWHGQDMQIPSRMPGVYSGASEGDLFQDEMKKIVDDATKKVYGGLKAFMSTYLGQRKVAY